MKMPNLLGERYKEWAALGVAQEHIIDWEVIPRGAHLRYQDYRIIMRSVNATPAHQLMVTRLTCWWLPVYGADAAEVVTDVAGLKLLYDKYVPKVADDRDASIYLSLIHI